MADVQITIFRGVGNGVPVANLSDPDLQKEDLTAEEESQATEIACPPLDGEWFCRVVNGSDHAIAVCAGEEPEASDADPWILSGHQDGFGIHPGHHVAIKLVAAE